VRVAVIGGYWYLRGGIVTIGWYCYHRGVLLPSGGIADTRVIVVLQTSNVVADAGDCCRYRRLLQVSRAFAEGYY
jgi:hypothetical protein